MNLEKISEKIKETQEKFFANKSDLKNLENKEKILESLEFYLEDDRVISSKKAKEEIEEQEELDKNKLIINTGLKTFDKLTRGFREGNVIVITGATKNGKTSLAQTFTENFSNNQINSLWFSYEVPIEQFLEKYENISIPLFFLPRRLKDNKIEWIEKRIIEAIAKFNVKVVFIDHLHYILDMQSVSKNVNVSLQIGSIMRRLKRIAIEYRIVIVLLAHLTKVKMTEAPCLSDLRDSSFIAQEADMVIMIWRKIEENTMPPVYSDESVLSIQAIRQVRGKTGNIDLIFKDGSFKELLEEIENPPNIPTSTSLQPQRDPVLGVKTGSVIEDDSINSMNKQVESSEIKMEDINF